MTAVKTVAKYYILANAVGFVPAYVFFMFELKQMGLW